MINLSLSLEALTRTNNINQRGANWSRMVAQRLILSITESSATVSHQLQMTLRSLRPTPAQIHNQINWHNKLSFLVSNESKVHVLQFINFFQKTYVFRNEFSQLEPTNLKICPINITQSLPENSFISANMPAACIDSLIRQIIQTNDNAQRCYCAPFYGP